MELVVTRSQPVGLAQPGEMFIDGQHAAWTLENGPKMIPTGRYQVTLYPSPHFQRMMPLLNDVPGRSDILIHWGNSYDDYEGCIGVGETRDPATGEIFNTRAMWDKLMPAIEGAIDHDADGCWITVA